MDTTQFIALCDGIPAEVRTGSPKGGITQEERVRIKDTLARSIMGAPYAEFMKLRTGFIYLQYIDKSKDYAPYYYILEKISEHFNGSTKYIAEWDAQAWKAVIAYCKSLPEYPRTNAFTNVFQRTRERERAKAATRLTKYGATPAVVDCELKISNLEGVYQKIEQLMTEIGGEQALEMNAADKSKALARFIYDMRCCIVHNKEAEFHISYNNYEEYKNVTPLLKEVHKLLAKKVWDLMNQPGSIISFENERYIDLF